MSTFTDIFFQNIKSKLVVSYRNLKNLINCKQIILFYKYAVLILFYIKHKKNVKTLILKKLFTTGPVV